MEQSENIQELAGALCKAQQESLFALTDKNNPFFKSKYADLSSVWSAAREPLTKNGLSVTQTMAPADNGHVIIVTTLMHTSGQWMRGKLPVPVSKHDPQALGSAITYGRRYSLAAMVGICPEDDDAEKAMSRNGNQYINEAQLSQLKNYTDNFKFFDEGRFLEIFKAESLEKLPSARFAAALKALQDKARKEVEENAG